MMQAKENQQQFNVVKENILPLAATKPNQQLTKGNALQSTKGMSVHVQNIQQHVPAKAAGLQVSKQSSNLVNQTTSSNVGQNVKPAVATTALQAKPNGHHQPPPTKGIQSKMNGPKDNGKNRQSLKPAKQNEIVDGKIKKVAAAKPNSASKGNRKSKKSNEQNGQKTIVAVSKPQNKDTTKPTAAISEQQSKQADCDFVIFCDENDELTIKAVEKENALEQRKADGNAKIEKKKGLVERNVKPQQQLQNLTLNDTTLNEITLDEQSSIENKENDPTLMSIDMSKMDEEMDIQTQQDHYKDVSGDMCVREFSNEIYLYLLERELKFLPDPTYITKQPEINSKMRAMLVDWLIDVGIEYELENETVFLTISYIDQFLSSLTISLQNFQLLGTAALFIASKYEEIYPPELKDFIFVTDDAYTKLQMLSMEKVILKALNFSVSPPTIFYFLKYFLTELSLPIYVQYFAEYLCFLSLLHTDPFLSYSPSDIAISSIILALHTYTITDLVNLDEFKQLTKIHFCKDDEGKLSDAKAILIRQSCVNAMYKLQKTAVEDTQQAIYTKYRSEKYLSVATVEIADEVPLVENFFN